MNYNTKQQTAYNETPVNENESTYSSNVIINNSSEAKQIKEEESNGSFKKKRKNNNDHDDTREYPPNRPILTRNTENDFINTTSTKKNCSAVQSVSDPVNLWVAITFCLQKDLMSFINSLLTSPRKETLLYLSNILKRQIPFVLCTSGWGHVKSLDFIYTNFDTFQSRTEQGQICIYLSSPSTSILLVISLPLMTCVIKEYIQTVIGTFTTKPSFTDVNCDDQKRRMSIIQEESKAILF